MKLHTFALGLTAVCLLAACQDQAKPAQPTASQTAASAASTATSATASVAEAATASASTMPADIEKLLINSPYFDFQVAANRTIVIAGIKEASPNLTAEQQACLLSPEGNPNYLAVLEPFVQSVLSKEEIAQADAFFGSDAGRAFTESALRQAGMENLPPPTPVSSEQKQQINEAVKQPFVVKMQEANAKMSEAESDAFMQKIITAEIQRCGLKS